MSEIFGINPIEIINQKTQKNILEGRGLQEIPELKWKNFREVLKNLSYADIIHQQIRQIDNLKSQPQNKNTPPKWLTHSQNSEAETRASGLGNKLSEQYKLDGLSSFSVFMNGKKLTTRSKKNEGLSQQEFFNRPTTRIYLSVLTKNAPEIYKSLFDSLIDNHCFEDKIDLVLNLENFTTNSLNESFDNNTIIIYCFGKNPPIENVAKAIDRAKKSNPRLWGLSKPDLIKTKEKNIKEFMIPLDDTTALVEVGNVDSYHARSGGNILFEITGKPVAERITLNELEEEFKKFNPNKPGLFSEQQITNRKRYMPALVEELS